MISSPTPGTPKMIKRVTLGAAGTTFDFTGLSILGYHAFKLFLYADNNTAGGGSVVVQINADTTATNYYRQYISANNAAITGARQNNNTVADVAASSNLAAELTVLRSPDGYVTVKSEEAPCDASAIQYALIAVKKSAVVTDVTQITLVSSVNFKAGSTVILYGFP